MKITEYRVLQNNELHPVLDVVSIHNWNGKNFLSSDKIVDMVNKIFKINRANEEYCYVLSFSASMEFKGIYQLAHGSAMGAQFSLRELFTFLLLSGAEQFYVVHNHPGNDLTPSDEDKGITLQMQVTGNILGIAFEEHYIVSRRGFRPIKEETSLKIDV